MSPQDAVEITCDVDVQTDGEHYRQERTETRTYRFQIDSYKDLRKAVSADGTDILCHFMDAARHNDNTRNGWSVTVGDGEEVWEGNINDVSVNVFDSSVYRLCAEGCADSEKAYDRLHKIATADRAQPEAAEALARFLFYNTGTERHDLEDEWYIPSSVDLM